MRLSGNVCRELWGKVGGLGCYKVLKFERKL
jgi:hypothetical protein